MLELPVCELARRADSVWVGTSVSEDAFQLVRASSDAAVTTEVKSNSDAALRQSENTPGLEHRFAYRVSVPTVFWGNYYFTIFAGPERRNSERLARDGQTSLARRSIFASAILFLLFGFAVFGGVCAAYLVKSALGIDLFPGGSILHPLFVQTLQ